MTEPISNEELMAEGAKLFAKPDTSMPKEEVAEVVRRIESHQSTRIKWTSEEESFSLRLNGNWFTLWVGDKPIKFDSSDPNVAREIAVFLAAWANAQDGKGYIAPAIQKLRPPRELWRKGFYERNVGRMTPETIQRNYKDLRELVDDTPDTPENREQLQDMISAIAILRDHGAVE